MRGFLFFFCLHSAFGGEVRPKGVPNANKPVPPSLVYTLGGGRETKEGGKEENQKENGKKGFFFPGEGEEKKT